MSGILQNSSEPSTHAPLPDLGDQFLYFMLHLFIEVVSKVIRLPGRVWDVPEYDLAAFLQVTRPGCFLCNDNSEIGCIDHFRKKLLSFFFTDVHAELSSDVLY